MKTTKITRKFRRNCDMFMPAFSTFIVARCCLKPFRRQSFSKKINNFDIKISKGCNLKVV